MNIGRQWADRLKIWQEAFEKHYFRPWGSCDLSFCCVMDHLTPEEAERFGVRDRQVVKLRTLTDRPVVFENVAVRVSPEFASFVHLDYDEANACGFRKGDLGRILP